MFILNIRAFYVSPMGVASQKNSYGSKCVNMNNPILVIPTLDDLDALYAVEQVSHPYPWSQSQLASCFGDRYLQGALMFEQQFIGFYCADYLLGESTLMNICVDPSQRGHHYGRLLLQDYLNRSQALGATDWFLEVRANNRVAQQLYASIGYFESGRRKNYYQAGDAREDAIVMHKTIAI